MAAHMDEQAKRRKEWREGSSVRINDDEGGVPLKACDTIPLSGFEEPASNVVRMSNGGPGIPPNTNQWGRAN